MNTGTAGNPVRVVLDTNILTSALVFGGKPEKILRLALEKRIQVIFSPILQAELADIIAKKFPLSLEDMYLLKTEMQKSFVIVYPQVPAIFRGYVSFENRNAKKLCYCLSPYKFGYFQGRR